MINGHKSQRTTLGKTIRGTFLTHRGHKICTQNLEYFLGTQLNTSCQNLQICAHKFYEISKSRGSIFSTLWAQIYIGSNFTPPLRKNWGHSELHKICAHGYSVGINCAQKNSKKKLNIFSHGRSIIKSSVITALSVHTNLV